jgi:hypothetical protein
MTRDFASFKELYSQKITQQEQLTKQLRRQQKELKETSGVMTNQKSSFRDLQNLLETKLASLTETLGPGGQRMASESKQPESMSFGGGGDYFSNE